jgi:ABC-2 type transport system permease protein
MTATASAAGTLVQSRQSSWSVLTAAIRSEWTKLRTVRSTMWALIFTVVSIVGLGVLFSLLEVSRWDRRTPADIQGFDPLLYAFGGISLAQLSLGVLGVLVMTSEYTRNGIRLTLAATPQRGLLLVAKATTFAAVVAVVSLISCMTAFFVCQAIFAPKHAGVSITDPGVLRAVLGGAGHLVLIGIIAVAVGAIVRHTAGAVALLVGVLLILPGLALLLPAPWHDNVNKFLPSSAGIAMSAVYRFPELLSPAAAFAVLLAYTVVTFAAATMVFRRRDA